MPNIRDQKQDESGIFALFKGNSGAGKTVGALSWPGVYSFDFDKKLPGVALKHFPDRDINYDTFDNIFDVSDKLSEFSNSCPYETLVFDSLTHLVVNILNTVGTMKGEKAIDRLRKIRDTSGGGKMVELMGIDYYNAETNFIELYLIDALKALFARPGNPKNIIMIAHVMVTESAPDLKTKIVTTTSSIVTAGRKVASYVPTCFDDVWHFAHEMGFDDGNVRRLALTQNFGTESAKTSFRLPNNKLDFTGTAPLFEDGDLYKIFMKHLKGDISL